MAGTTTIIIITIIITATGAIATNIDHKRGRSTNSRLYPFCFLALAALKIFCKCRRKLYSKPKSNAFRRTMCIDFHEYVEIAVPVCALLFTHFVHNDIRFFRHDDDLGEWLAWSENVCRAFRRRLEDDKIQHRPPISDQRRNRNRHGIGLSE